MRNLFFLFFVFTSSLIFAQEQERFSHDRLIVKVMTGASFPKLEGVTKVKNLFENVFLVYSNQIEKIEQKLNSDPSIIYVQKDFIRKRNIDLKFQPIVLLKGSIATPFNDPDINKQWALASSANNGVSVFDAYMKNQGNKKTVVVAIVDTGIDFDHQDLKQNIWTNKNEIPGNGIDDDQNGYIDDIYGINTLNRDRSGNATSDNKDTEGHGTHVAGIIGAVQNNNFGIAGIAQKVKLMGIRTVPNDGDEKDADVVEAFVYAAKNGAKLINCSFGKSVNEGGMAVADAINYIGKEFGTLVVAAAGNDSVDIDKKPTYPASFGTDYLMVVASTEKTGNLSYFSNFGIENVDLAAPGGNIYSTLPNNKFASLSGTSMASPVAVGVAAEILSIRPDLNALELKALLLDTVTKKSTFETKIKSGGRIDLLKAVDTLN
jgi:thermitase